MDPGARLGKARLVRNKGSDRAGLSNDQDMTREDGEREVGRKKESVVLGQRT